VKNKKRWMDIGLVIIIFVMAVFVYLELDRMLKFARGFIGQTSTDAPPIITETTPPTTAPIRESDDVREVAPDFELVDLDGELVSLSDYLGTPVMINFWAIWCLPCRSELPLIQAFADQYPEDLVVLAVNTSEDQTNVFHFKEEFGYDLIFLFDFDNSVADEYRVRGLPTSIFIDSDGIWQATHIGELNETLLSAYLGKIGVTQ